MCPTGLHESINQIAKLLQNLKFLVSCKNVIETTRQLHVQVTITVLNTIYRLQGIKQISGARRCRMKREQFLQMKRPRALRNERRGASSSLADKHRAQGHCPIGPWVNPPLGTANLNLGYKLNFNCAESCGTASDGVQHFLARRG